jgi:hypothetical protein
MDHPEFPLDLGALDAGTYLVTLRNLAVTCNSMIILY